MRTDTNILLVSHLIKHRATTRLEISACTGLDKVSISQKLKTLISVGFIEKKGRIGAPYRSRGDRGPGISLWGILDAEPQDYVDAQRRYGEIILATKPQPRGRQCQMEEAILLCRNFMDAHPGVRVGDTWIWERILVDNNIRRIDVGQLQLQLQLKLSGIGGVSETKNKEKEAPRVLIIRHAAAVSLPASFIIRQN